MIRIRNTDTKCRTCPKRGYVNAEQGSNMQRHPIRIVNCNDYVSASSHPRHPSRCCGFWTARGGADKAAWQSPGAKIGQRRPGGAACAKNVFLVEGTGLGRFGNKSKCSLRSLSDATHGSDHMRLMPIDPDRTTRSCRPWVTPANPPKLS